MRRIGHSGVIVRIRWAGLFAQILALILAGGAAASDDNSVCYSCHESSIGGIKAVDPKSHDRSIHGTNLCVSCHPDAGEIPHPAPLAPVRCASCHRLEARTYLESDHGLALSNGVGEAATCTSCHGKTHMLLSSRDPASPTHRKNIAGTCARCHADVKAMSKFRLSQRMPFDTYEHSVHGEAFRKGRINAATCPDCHGTHDLHVASNPRSKVYRSNVPRTCGRCHENVDNVFERSVHGVAVRAGVREAPVCTDCHGEHTIRPVLDPASFAHRGAITDTCVDCHASERIIAKFGFPADRQKTFRDSYHGLAGRLGDLRAANCASCHGWHDVLPSSDPMSSINQANLPQTCGKCHRGAEERLISTTIHGGGAAGEHFAIKWVRIFYYVLIPLTIGGMLVHNVADYLRKALRGHPAGAGKAEHPGEELLNLNERIQHGLLLATFTLLGYSGFALKFPEAWWAAPFQMAGGEMVRKGVHRWTALVFVLSGIYHLLYVFATVRGRDLLFRKYVPVLRDAADAAGLMLYNLGLRKARPELPHPSYIEKAEYWALIWGGLIMSATGVLLVYNDLTLKYFPLWVSNLATTVHFLEAVLAGLAILVWHAYWAVFDPDVYPMNWAWLTGRIRLRRDE